MTDATKFDQRLEIIKIRIWEIGQVFVELWKGFCRKDPVLFRALIVSLIFAGLILFQVDVWILKRMNFWKFYPSDGLGFRFYVASMIWLPVLFFGIKVRNQKKMFARNLNEVYELVGLKNAIGCYPNFLSLEPISGGTMKLRLTNGSFTLLEWQKRKERLEANMRVFVDEIRQVHDKGIIEMTFSYEPMPTKVSIENIRGYRDYTFLLGRDRSRNYIGDFAENPHLLVAGETGGGKSALLRQLIITIKLNHPEAEFYIVDLKGGVEFGYLTNLPGIKVISEVNRVASALKIISATIDLRIKKLKEKNLNDIKQFFMSDEFRKMTTEEKRHHSLGHRTFVVVDECAEIFLFGLGHEAADTREIRGAMSRITRLGRAVGVHVVLATQRPDKNAVDPQVKTNLTSTICYRVHDHGASLAILGTGRATDLPKIPGRAILRRGSEEIEIQTPFLDFADSKKLLEDAFKINLDADSNQMLDSASSSKEKDNGQTVKPDSL